MTTQRVRPWSTVTEVPSGTGRLWRKQNRPGTAYEGPLTGVLHRLSPSLVPEVVEVDRSQAVFTQRDAGPPLREVVSVEGRWQVWERLLPRYAAAQLAWAPHAEELLALGLPDLRPVVVPHQLSRLVDELGAWAPDVGGLGPAEIQQAHTRLVPAVTAWCEELARSRVPSSVQHDDLHDGNVCGSDGETARIIDWGDASFGHPLGTMLVTLNALADRAGVAEGHELEDPRVRRLVEAYLEPFTVHDDLDALWREVVLVRRTGGVVRALTWRRALATATVAEQAAHDFPVRAWLREVGSSLSR